jgi:DNA-binding ferritin-like protein (Dps family)
MTEREKEIRDSERKVFAEVRRAKRLTMKERESMTPEEYKEHMKEIHKEMRALGHKLVPSKR